MYSLMETTSKFKVSVNIPTKNKIYVSHSTPAWDLSIKSNLFNNT